MTSNNYTYVIINASEVADLDFSKIKETNGDTLRYNNAGNKTFVRFEGIAPSFLEGKTHYTHSEILEHLKDSSNGWISSGE